MKKTGVIILFVASVFIVALAYSKETPSLITLNSISNLYGPVKFSHKMHIDFADSCTTCHHHGKGGAISSCRSCHEPIGVYHYKGSSRGPGLGLKGAYHTLCIGCHKENESGPTGCNDCHIKKSKARGVQSRR